MVRQGEIARAKATFGLRITVVRTKTQMGRR
eukprot:SAG31_NODE_32021_length_361_cov_0.671756_1_plen_30_part_10